MCGRHFCLFYNGTIKFSLGEEKMRDLKTLAMQAKNRLKGISTQGDSKGNLRLMEESSNQIRVIVTEDDGEKIYEKFKDLIAMDGLYNPIACMMDKKIYNQLCDNKKEKYFFDTLEKYQKLRERCCRENDDLNIFVS